MNTHGIPAAVWQLQAAKEGQLKAIVLPLEKYVEKPLRDLDLLGQGKAAKDGDGDWILWFPGEDRQEVLDKITLDFYPKGLKEGIIIPFKDGDRIFLQEEWDYFLDKLEGELCYPLKRTSPMYPYGMATRRSHATGGCSVLVHSDGSSGCKNQRYDNSSNRVPIGTVFSKKDNCRMDRRLERRSS
jgi:hypothetical protein